MDRRSPAGIVREPPGPGVRHPSRPARARREWGADGGGPPTDRRRWRPVVHPRPGRVGTGAAARPTAPRARAVMLLDSNILIYAARPEHDDLRRWVAGLRPAPAVSAISYVEVLGYHRLTDA